METKVYKYEKNKTAEIMPKLETDAFKRTGYIIRDGENLGEDKNYQYVHIRAEDEFFEENKDALSLMTQVEGEEKNRVQAKIEQEQDSAATGIGAIFG